MGKHVREAMTPAVRTASPTQSLVEAARLMRTEDAGSIPVVEDKPLARSLYAAVDVDRPIPAEFYRAVAEIVHLIQQRKGQWAQRRS